jgi:hypothetical protein
MNKEQNTSRNGNIAELSSPGDNFCVPHTEDTFQAHEHNSPQNPVLIPLMNEQEAKYCQIWKYCITTLLAKLYRAVPQKLFIGF